MTKIALIAGVGSTYKDYRNLRQKLSRFQRTDDAVESMIETLKGKDWKTKMLVEKECRKQDILDQLRTNLEAAKKGNDVELLFYFRGHGMHTIRPGNQQDNSGENRYDECLITWEPRLASSRYFSDNNIYDYFLTDDELTRVIRESLPYVKRYYVILDCCYAGGMLDLKLSENSPLVFAAASSERQQAKGYRSGITFFTAALTDILQQHPKDLTTLRADTENRLRRKYSAAPRPLFRIPHYALYSPAF
jgi:hypothetical protein